MLQKPIHAPFCQGNVAVFGKNAGQQSVAMSPYALIYSKRRRITSVDDMIQIMIVGKQLYSSLSLLARQSMLMLKELPGMVTVFERFFQLEYSESYSCNKHVMPELRGITTVYRKIPKISPGVHFWRGLYSEGLIYGGEICVSKSIGLAL